MPLRIIPLVNQHFYHIFNRGVNKQPIFSNKIDYERMINLVRYYKYQDHPSRFSNFIHLSNSMRKEVWVRIKNSNSYVDIVSYCLMPNHFHLLVKQNLGNGISKFLSDMQNSYTRYYNTKHERTGHLFQGQFKSVLIQSDDQLSHVSRYIHLNPYSSGLVKTLDGLDKYQWSSLGEFVKGNDFSFCTKDSVLNMFKTNDDYVKFVHDNADYQKRLEDIKHLIFD